MTSSIGLFASLEDYHALLDHAQSIGLCLVMDPNEAPSTDPGEKPFCYLSPLPESQLHTLGTPPRYSYGLDPLLLFMRPYYRAPYLVAGFVQWFDGNERFAAITKSPYEKLRRWIRKHWTKPNRSGFYSGPGAMALLAQGAEQVNRLPTSEATLTFVTVPSSSKSPLETNK